MFGRGKQDVENETRRILVVEDEPLIAFDTEHLLTDAGYEVVATVDNAAEALRLIAAGGIDLVTADVNLRGQGTGIDIARKAREAGLAVLFVSGQCPVEAQALAHGCLAKPYAPRDLLAAIAAVIAVRAGGKATRVPRGLTLYGA
jgi:DNA-binding response OmpR family regulator